MEMFCKMKDAHMILKSHLFLKGFFPSLYHFFNLKVSVWFEMIQMRLKNQFSQKGLCHSHPLNLS